MMLVLQQLFLLCSLLIASLHASPISVSSKAYHPVVIWHGLGDSAYSEGMQSLASDLKEAFPGIDVYIISLADTLASDQKAGFFGNVNDQIEHVCRGLKERKELENGFDAIGFSQGGEKSLMKIESKERMRELREGSCVCI